MFVRKVGLRRRRGPDCALLTAACSAGLRASTTSFQAASMLVFRRHTERRGSSAPPHRPSPAPAMPSQMLALKPVHLDPDRLRRQLRARRMPQCATRTWRIGTFYAHCTSATAARRLRCSISSATLELVGLTRLEIFRDGSFERYVEIILHIVRFVLNAGWHRRTRVGRFKTDCCNVVLVYLTKHYWALG